MKDRIAGAPGQYSAVVSTAEYEKLQNGQPFAITMTRNDEPIIEGTPYNKAAVLPDELAQRLCPETADPTPADAFAALLKIAAPIARGTTDIDGGTWTWNKWENGEAECCGIVTLELDQADKFKSTKTVTLPIEFKASKPLYMVHAFASLISYDTFVSTSHGNAAVTVNAECDATNVDSAGLFVKDAITVTACACCTENNLLSMGGPTVSVCVKGRWK